MPTVLRTPGGTIVRLQPADFTTLRRHIRQEYQLLPGLRLTFAQVCRFCNLDAERCAALLHSMVAEGSLELTPEGFYCHPLSRSRIQET